MTVTVNTIAGNPQIPGATDYVYVPDQLIAGNLKIVTGQGVLTGGVVIPRGTVLGQVLEAAPSAPVATAGNVGNGTITAVASGGKAKVGTYVVSFTGPTAYTVLSPNGTQLAPGKAAGAYVDAELSFTFTPGATAMGAGDSFAITVGNGSGSYRPCVATATDGSQAPCAVAVDTVDVTAGDLLSGVYLMAELNGNALILDPSLSLPAVAAALRPLGLFVKSAVSAADPT
ncbi:head decoration protein [Methylobacterium sp. J-030]|uniref:head decoration protein n=1 Tax=Methylobacterium sp. J-030 TaxID=2836627 RepID=UPI001FB8E873|nr:head decoration protein [Methylobacterium sp. J-030]MCJ2067760.1 head decoration protein [Methylobacterium sp. J-030]